MNWSDLGPRVYSAIAMVVIAMVALIAGGIWFQALVAVSGGIMVWEIARMTGQDDPRLTAVVPVLSVAGLMIGGGIVPILVIGLTVALGLLLKAPNRVFLLVSVAIVILACQAISGLYATSLTLLVWMVLVVIASDVGGYFVGRFVGGPKFWPAVSPKKTWSGTIGGWVLAMAVGVGFVAFVGAGWTIVVMSAIVALAAQFGDIAESALKRKMDIKDSSDLIPGHGGFCDRFDGVVGAAALVSLLSMFGLMPLVL